MITSDRLFRSSQSPGLMTADADFPLRVVIEDLMKFQELLHGCPTRIPGVAKIRSSFALEQVKYTTALPTQHPVGRQT